MAINPWSAEKAGEKRDKERWDELEQRISTQLSDNWRVGKVYSWSCVESIGFGLYPLEREDISEMISRFTKAGWNVLERETERAGGFGGVEITKYLNFSADIE